MVKEHSSEEELIESAASCLDKGEVLAWFQGKSGIIPIYVYLISIYTTSSSPHLGPYFRSPTPSKAGGGTLKIISVLPFLLRFQSLSLQKEREHSLRR